MVRVCQVKRIFTAIITQPILDFKILFKIFTVDEKLSMICLIIKNLGKYFHLNLVKLGNL